MEIFSEDDMLRMMDFAYEFGRARMQKLINPESDNLNIINDKICTFDFNMLIWTIQCYDDKVDAIHNMMYNDKYKSLHEPLNIIYDKIMEYKLRNELIVYRGWLRKSPDDIL